MKFKKGMAALLAAAMVLGMIGLQPAAKEHCNGTGKRALKCQKRVKVRPQKGKNRREMGSLFTRKRSLRCLLTQMRL